MICDKPSEVKGMKVAVSKPGKLIQEICNFHGGYWGLVAVEQFLRCCMNVEMGVLGVQDHRKERFCLFYQLHLWYVSLVARPSLPGEGRSRPSDRINRTRSGREKSLTSESKS